jgi:hypothetical protein
MTTVTNKFRVVAVSDNTNSFGLHQFVAVAKDGEGYKLHTCYLYKPKKGDDITIVFNLDEKTGRRSFKEVVGMGIEMPEKIGIPAPKEVLEEIYKA